MDSGGHYLEGTTDITRTFALGPVTEEMKADFTRVCRSNMNLANARFLYGCSGMNLDIIAREPFWEAGLDFKHGTGHGVGYVLNVHEGPNAFRYKGTELDHWEFDFNHITDRDCEMIKQIYPPEVTTDYLQQVYDGSRVYVKDGIKYLADFSSRYVNVIMGHRITMDCPLQWSNKIIVNRHVVNDEDVRIFITPTRDDFHNPFLFKGMDIAVDRIIKAINNKEKILIYGDYDVDGITSTTVLKKYLMDRGISVDTYIPNRLHEGYGLNKKAIDTIKERNIDLIITVDCGISAIEEVDYAVRLGMDIIVTDHHEVGEKLPNALAVIDAKRKDNTYPFRALAGVGVVFKLIQALSIKLEIKPEEYLKYLDLVCVGTISDIVPLEGENRTIAKLWLNANFIESA